MLQLQRVILEGLLGASRQQGNAADSSATGTTTSTESVAVALPTNSPPSAAPAPTTPVAATEAAPSHVVLERVPEPASEPTPTDLPFAPAPVQQNAARGARYYQQRPSPAARSVAPEGLELLRRLQEMRESSDLILQFGPYKGSTLAHVAISDPEYIRQLMTCAQRPEVRVAAGRLVQALDAAAEHKAKTRSSARRGRPSHSAGAQMTKGLQNCERCAEFSRELVERQQRVRPHALAVASLQVAARSAGSKAWISAAIDVARYATALLYFAHGMRPRSKVGNRSDVSEVEHV